VTEQGQGKSWTLAELASLVGGQVLGDPALSVVGVRPLDEAGPQHLSFYHNRKYLAAARSSRAGALLVQDPAPFAGRNLLVHPEPYLALAKILEVMVPPRRPRPGVHPTAVVAPTARLGEQVSIGPCAVVGEHVVLGDRVVVGPTCVIGEGCQVGDDTVLHPGVVLEPGCQVGARCILHAGVVVGSDGFGFATSGGVHHKVPQVGRVVIEDDVELGANVCVDRATLGETRIGRGTKVDNLVQIGHNVVIGEGCLLVAQTGIAGSSKLGRGVILAGQAGVTGHVTVGDGAVVTAKAGAMEDVPPRSMVSGMPARPHREWLAAQARLYRLEKLLARVAELEERLSKLEEAHAGR
jgi:UDP-3-O-[3-hydroxymyristoyl] glucosamine N-acyltransferase